MLVRALSLSTTVVYITAWVRGEFSRVKDFKKKKKLSNQLPTSGLSILFVLLILVDTSMFSKRERETL